MGKASRPRTQFPYYKVHVLDPEKLAWVDGRKEAFESLAEAKSFIADVLQHREARIFVVTSRGRSVYEEA
jgi:hypothetical protein